MPEKIDKSRLTAQFSAGKPTDEKAFSNLIHSSMNTVNERAERKTTPDGKDDHLTVGAGPEGGLMGFSRDIKQKDPDFKIGLSGKNGGLELHTQSGKNAALHLNPEGKLGLGTDKPDSDLHVAGSLQANSVEVAELSQTKYLKVEETAEVGNLLAHGAVSMSHRFGNYQNIFGAGPASVPADGNWHNVTGILTGLQAFEIMAYVAEKNNYGVTHATAVNAFGDQSSDAITKTRSYYGKTNARIDIQWKKLGTYTFALQAKTGMKFTEGKRINFFLTRLLPEHLNDELTGSEGKDKEEESK